MYQILLVVDKVSHRDYPLSPLSVTEQLKTNKQKVHGAVKIENVERKGAREKIKTFARRYKKKLNPICLKWKHKELRV